MNSDEAPQPSGTDEQSAAVTVAAGLLEADGSLTSTMPSVVVRRRLQRLLTPSALWVPAGYGGQSLEVQQGVAPRWKAPSVEISGDLAAQLDGVWESIVNGPRPRAGMEPVLRVTVDGIPDTERLVALGTRAGVRIVPTIHRRAEHFSWRWPLKVSVADGPRAVEWVERLRAGRFADELYDVQVDDEDSDQPVDILILDGDQAGHAALGRRVVTCVMMVGDASADWLLHQASDAIDSAITVGMPVAGVDWFGSFVEELSHDHPVDVAITHVAPDSRVAGASGLIDYTSVGRWASAVGQFGPEARALPMPEMLDVLRNSSFDHESDGARQVVELSRANAAVGVDTTLRLDHHREIGGLGRPGEREVEIEVPPVPSRRLLVEVTRSNKLCRKALAPNQDHHLEVRIAVPVKKDQGLPFDENAVPADGGVADLTVDVCSPDGEIHETALIKLPTADRAAPSSTALISFRTKEEGSIVDLKVLILYRGRPIQGGRVIASVRTTAARTDRIQFLAIPLSAPPEPAADTSSADVTIDATTDVLIRKGDLSSEMVDMGAARQIIDAIEREASRVLGTDHAPPSLLDESARLLMVTLARKGFELRAKLDRLNVGDAKAIAVLVGYDSTLVPFELAYDGPLPNFGAKLCAHVSRPGRPAQPCRGASTTTVCPYEFWGLKRVIARTIQARLVGRPVLVSRRIDPLALSPVLYAAADRADENSPEDQRPSDLIEKALIGIFGSDKLTRVKSWRAWGGAVRTTNPQLLVVLGHTEVVGTETTIEIGRHSRLAQPAVSRRVVGSAGGPAPIVLLLACASALAGDAFGALPSTFTDRGAAAVVATLTKLKGEHGARAAVAVVNALCVSSPSPGVSLGAALMAARKSLIADGLIVGMLLISHGEIDVKLRT